MNNEENNNENNEEINKGINKGIVSSLIILVSFLSILALAIIFSNRSSETSDLVSKSFIFDRVFYKFSAIENTLLQILNGGIANSFGGINITIETDGFNKVTFDEVLPRDTSDFNTQATYFQNFAQTKMNETNMFIDLNLVDIICGSITIQPYGINYTHYPNNCINAPAQTEVIIDPGPSWGNITGYELTFMPNGNISTATISGWNGPGCGKGSLELNETVIGLDTSIGTNVNFADYAKMCRYNVDNIACPGGLGYIHVIQNQNSRDADKAVLDIQVQPNCNITTRIAINLTKTTSMPEVTFPNNQTIKIKETLYEIEKNSSITIS